MKSSNRLIARAQPVLLCVFFAVVVVFAFGKMLAPGACLFPPVDGSPHYPPDYSTFVWQSFSGCWVDVALGENYGISPFYPNKFLAVVLPRLMYHEVGYMLDVFLLCVAGCYYLVGRRIRGVPLAVASVGLGLMGYYFTLVSAGHRGVYDMVPYGVFILGLIDRAIERGSLLHYALIGACVSFGLIAQPDILVMFAGLGAVYALYRLISEHRRGELTVVRRLGRVGLGCLFALLFFSLFSSGTVEHIQNVVMLRRQEQIDSTVSREAEDSRNDQGDEWEFATNWSLPPEDMIEFVAPCVYGIETANREGPYWGRLGRSLGWLKNQRQGLMNLRQHTVYMGGIQFVFALFAVGCALAGLIRRASPIHSGSPQEPDDGDLFF